MNNYRLLRIAKVLTSIFAFMVILPDKYLPVPIGIVTWFVMGLSPFFVLFACIYYGLIFYFFISAYRNSSSMLDDVVILVAVAVSYFFIAQAVEDWIEYGGVASWTTLLLYVAASLITFIYTIKRMAYKLT